MLDKEPMKAYRWEDSRTRAHCYLLPSIERIFDKLRVLKDAVILDAGCGGGHIAQELYNKNYKNIWGFDASESGIEIAKNILKGVENRFEVHNAYHIELPSSFPKKGYDIVLSVEVIEHMYSPKKYLENIGFWLKKGGILIITTPYHGYIKNLFTCLSNKFDKHFNPLWEGGHIKFFSKNTLYRTFEEAGIKPLEFCGSGRLPFLWKSMIIVGKND